MTKLPVPKRPSDILVQFPKLTKNLENAAYELAVYISLVYGVDPEEFRTEVDEGEKTFKELFEKYFRKYGTGLETQMKVVLTFAAGMGKLHECMKVAVEELQGNRPN